MKAKLVEFIRLIFTYLWDKKKPIILFFLVAIVFAVVFSLYELPIEAVFYATLLGLGAAIYLMAYDFYKYVKRHRDLQRLLLSVRDTLDELPAPQGLMEQDFVLLIEALHEEKGRLMASSDQAYGEMIDYFTLWAHQIKTPISAMRLLLEEGAGQRDALSAELFKVEQYVEMVLCFMRLSSETTDYVFKSCDLNELIRQAIRKYSRLFILKGIKLEYEGVNRHLLTDEKWFSFALEQLLSNAVKYTAKGSVRIGIEGDFLVIEDTGIGIAPEDLPRIFEKGFTGYNGREDKHATGIGLYLCRRILNSLNHDIRIESKEGVGTRVSVNLLQKNIPID